MSSISQLFVSVVSNEKKMLSIKTLQLYSIFFVSKMIYGNSVDTGGEQKMLE